VTTTVWMADMDVSPNFVGTKPYPNVAGKAFEYTLQGDPTDPDDGAWSGASRAGRFAHPGRIWYPQATVRNDDRALVSPGLDRQTIANILAGSDGTDLTPTPTPTETSLATLLTATPTPTAMASPLPPTASPAATASAEATAAPAATASAETTARPTTGPTQTLVPTPSATPAVAPRATPTKVPPRP
jgi:hypothetical protein